MTSHTHSDAFVALAELRGAMHEAQDAASSAQRYDTGDSKTAHVVALVMTPRMHEAERRYAEAMRAYEAGGTP